MIFSRGKSRATPSERLVVRLRNDFPNLNIGPEAVILRTRAKRWALQAGAWKWQLEGIPLHPGIGSQFTVKDCLRAKKLEAFDDCHLGVLQDWHIDPSKEDQREIGRRLARSRNSR